MHMLFFQKLTSRLTTAFSVIAHNHFSVQPSHEAVCEISHTYINLLFFPLAMSELIDGITLHAVS